ncbi:crosslink repair DNA glycosylase YcaQ family protein [Actinosynnema sp. NPDC020468]|uniref:DNA glycosylase AlkZ-like family protein n=1 Tax=Actinosynnema sp. NPDC020468 TaxID=3154488 RepID=UPI0033C82B95
MELTRARVLAHRAAAQGLSETDPSLGVLALGVVDSPPNTGRAAIAVRSPHHDEPLTRVLSLRGAPHLHRPADLPRLRAELRPRTPAQLRAWCGAFDPPDLAHLDVVVEAVHEHFPGDTATKAELSAALTPHVPADIAPHCPPCGAAHVVEGLFRLATLLAGVELEPRGAKLVFRRPTALPEPTDPTGPTLLRDYARFVGPFTEADAERWLGAPPSSRPDTTPVTVAGKTLLTCDDMPEATEATEPPAGLLLFPRDPYLLGPRWLVAEPDVAKRVWRPVGSPGALVLHGRVAGAWRHAISGRTMTFRVEGWSKVKGAARAAVKDQADVLAGVWGGNALEAVVVEW